MTGSIAHCFSRAHFICRAFLIAVSMGLTACGGGSSSPPVTTNPPSLPPPVQISPAFLSEDSTSRFLGQATYGATYDQITALTGTEVSDWIVSEFNKTPTNYFPTLLIEAQNLPPGEQLRPRRVSDLFFDAAIAGDDQLRQRMVFALSEIIVVSDASQLINVPLTMADYVDTLSDNAFGNYRELLEHITYTPAMSVYLTYIANEKGDPNTGRVPDENYARELMQLFTLGLVELNLDGTPKLDGQGEPIEIYDNTDITGLAKVFTGLSLDGNNFFNLGEDPTAFYRPLKMFPDFHSTLEKSFLGTTIPAGTSGEESVDLALDAIFNHPNMAPFLSRQLIQRFVTSDPTPSYVSRVATAFETGRFTLPNDTIVGDGRRGDLKATIAAVLLDDEAVQDRAAAPAEFGKVREPILRFTNWARAFGETTPDSGDERILVSTNVTGLGQHPFRSPSVFNFFRPGYVAPGTATGAAGLTAPELEIINESSAIGYINFINSFIYDFGENISGDPDGGVKADYTDLVALADDAQSLIDRLDLVLTGNGLDPEFKANMLDMMNDIPISTAAPDEDRLTRILVAISMTMTAPGYAVQR